MDAPAAAPQDVAADTALPAPPADAKLETQPVEEQPAASIVLPAPVTPAPPETAGTEPTPAPVPLDRRSLHYDLELNHTPIRNTTVLVGPAVWGAWDAGGVYPFPSHWAVQLHVENRSSEECASPRLAVAYDEGGTQEIAVPSLPAGQSVDLEIPLAPCQFAPGQRMCWVNISLEGASPGPAIRKNLRFDMVSDEARFQRMLGDTYITAVTEGDNVITK